MSHPKPGSPEFDALKAEWDQKLADSGLDDVERPPECRKGADPTLKARHASRYRDYIRPDNPGNHRHVPLDDLIACEDSESPPLLARDEESLWSSPLDDVAEALQHYRFKNRIDRKIARALHDGETWKSIKERLRVGRSRISRVQRQIRAWATVRREIGR